MIGTGPIFFVLALLPVAVLFMTIRSMQISLSNPERRIAACRAGLTRMPLLVACAPVFMTVWMLTERHFDPEFATRSFENADLVEPLSLFLFAVDQTVRAVAADALETFNVELSPLQHVCGSFLFCVSLVIYKAVISLATTVWILSAVSWAAMKVGRKPADA